MHLFSQVPGAVLGAISTTDTNFFIPLELCEAPDLRTTMFDISPATSPAGDVGVSVGAAK